MATSWDFSGPSEGLCPEETIVLGSEPKKEKRGLHYKVGLHMAQPPPGHCLPPTEKLGQ